MPRFFPPKAGVLARLLMLGALIIATTHQTCLADRPVASDAVDHALVSRVSASCTARDASPLLQALQRRDRLLVVPPQGLLINQPVEINHPLLIAGKGRVIVFNGNGSLRINLEAGALQIDDARLVFQHQSTPMEKFFIQVARGDLQVSGCRIYADVKPDMTLDYRRGPINWKSSTWLFAAAAPESSQVTIRFIGNRCYSLWWYGCGLLYSPRSAHPRHIFECSNNLIKGFHGALYLNSAASALVSQNRLYRNNVGNIVISGRNFRIVNNTILFSGNGTQGDGITARNATGVIVRGNTIFRGSCYGMWFRRNCHDVLVEQNTVIGGITSGISFSDPRQHASYSKITVANNVLAGNRGPGLVVQRVNGLTITGNVLQGNKGRAKCQILVLDCKQVTCSGNLLGRDTRERTKRAWTGSFGANLRPTSCRFITTRRQGK